jgi:hypothetical protein
MILPKFPSVKRITYGGTLLALLSGCHLPSILLMLGDPYDFATIYNVLPLWNAGLNGFGQSISILAASNINIDDVRNFRRVSLRR